MLCGHFYPLHGERLDDSFKTLVGFYCHSSAIVSLDSTDRMTLVKTGRTDERRCSMYHPLTAGSAVWPQVVQFPHRDLIWAHEPRLNPQTAVWRTDDRTKCHILDSQNVPMKPTYSHRRSGSPYVPVLSRRPHYDLMSLILVVHSTFPSSSPCLSQNLNLTLRRCEVHFKCPHSVRKTLLVLTM